MAGVGAGLAAHLGVGVALVRTALVGSAFLGGFGLVVYLLLWVAVPSGDPWAEAVGDLPAPRARIARRLESGVGQTLLTPRGRIQVGGGALLALAVGAGALYTGILPSTDWLLPLLLTATGMTLGWSQVGAVATGQRDLGAMARLGGGALLAAVGLLVWALADTPAQALMTSVSAGAALVAGTGLVLAPVWLSTTRAMTRAQAAEARQAERADIAAHLHDSVLQTLTVIRKRADEPETVARLARSQERELRAWLYTDRPEVGTSAAQALREVAAGTEDRYGVPVDVVVVGDRSPDEDCEVVLAAAREALSNAVRHGAPPVSVYAEIGPRSLEVFVRDHGPGFSPDAVAADRHGVRESIIGRMSRHGGRARIRGLTQGTEVQLALPAPSPGQDATQ